MTLDFGNFDGSEFISAVSAEGNGVISGKTVTWQLDHIPTFDQICFNVTILLSVDAQSEGQDHQRRTLSRTIPMAARRHRQLAHSPSHPQRNAALKPRRTF